MRSLQITVPALIAILIAFCFHAYANPSATNPDKGLAAHGLIKGMRPGCEDGKAAVERIYALYFSIEASATKAFEKKSNPSTIPSQKLSKDWATLAKAQRDAAHLKLMGEPAASDLSGRLSMLRQQIGVLIRAGISTPSGSKILRRAMDNLKRMKPKNDRFLEKQKQAIDSGQLESAEKALEGLAMQVDPDASFLTPKQREPYTAVLNALINTCRDKLDRKRVIAYRRQAKAAMDKNLLSFQQLDTEMARIVSELQTDGKAKIGDNESATAIDAIDHLDKLWGSASAALLRNWGIYWTFSGQTSQDQMDQLTSMVKGHLTSIIASAAKGPPESARETYAKILERITNLDRRASKPVSGACESALGQLAAADPSLPAQISSYKNATSEILRWRKKFALQQATRIKKTYPDVASLLNRKASLTKHRRAPMYRAPGTADRPVTVRQTNTNSSWAAYEGGTYLLGRRVSDGDTIRISPTSRTSVVPFNARYYASVAIGLPIDEQIQSLSTDLLVDDKNPPLSLEAADAISAAKLREYDSFGGVIRNIHMEPTAVRFIALPDPASAIVYRTIAPGTEEDIPAISDACWRVDVSPHWVQHDYFVVEIEKHTMAKKPN